MRSEKKLQIEYRKIQLTGGSTYIISLPKSWIDQFNLERGSIVKLYQSEDTSLNILPRDVELPEKGRKITFSTTESDASDTIIRSLVSAYLLGYNIIEITSNKKRIDPEIKSALKKYVRNNLMGTEIIKDLPNVLSLQILLSYSDLPIIDTIRRMALISTSMHREAISALSQENFKLAKEIINTDDEVDRFNLYLIRLLKIAVIDVNVLKKSGLSSTRICIDYRLIVKSIERTADHAVNIAKNCLTLTLIPVEKVILTELERVSKSALEVFEAAMEALYEGDYKDANRVIFMANEMQQSEDEIIHVILKNAHVNDIPSLRLIVESIMRTAEYGSDIAEIVLNMKVNEMGSIS